MNPRIKKIGRNILFLLSIPGIVGAFVFANSNKQDEKLHGIHIDIQNTELSFVTENDILQLLDENGVAIEKSVVNNVQINTLENVIKENKWVTDAEIYITANHDMNVKVTQKTPIVRINQTDSNDYAYYLDVYANPIELSNQYIAKVPIVTSPKLGYTRKDLQIKNDLVLLANYIQKDTFWNAMISQINLDHKYQIELIPTLGNHLILIGNIENLDSKMKRLFAFYQKGLQTIDWNRYNEIDLRFSHQVVARNTHAIELIDKTIEKDRLERIKADREKYLMSLQKRSNKINATTSSKKNLPVKKSTH